MSYGLNMERPYVRLLPNSPLYMNYMRGQRRAAYRFAEIFRSTWSRLPRSAKISILNYWRGGRCVVSVDLWPPSPDGNTLARLVPNCQLYFHPRIVRSAAVASAVISHELAHVYHEAIGTKYPPQAPDYHQHGPSYFMDPRETDAYDTAVESWGFEDLEMAVETLPPAKRELYCHSDNHTCNSVEIRE
jgi:hypothetical protein